MVNYGLIKERINILKNPQNEFKSLKEKTLESAVFDYIKVLFLLAIIAAILNFIISFVKVLYLTIFLTIDINYSRFLNYTIGQSLVLAYVYLILGTIGMLILSFLLHAFYTKIKYTELIKIISYSLTPVLILGWTPGLAMPLFIWSILLFVVGVNEYKEVKKYPKNTIDERD